ncbi:BON domain-containing protein [Mucilaginibacter aquatilis]|uniref:BON domain-containing protein n=1 Tax=Mucilaginibacter aquatilis TaxID=1517760 RepID=A0A6I4IC52_9SPHI|nr:BON domain-containing protein [Mucilaginibacter aquatilis]MVN92801.1 BON domain-containing protein [Mucilaginibacter aquatilis]
MKVLLAIMAAVALSLTACTTDSNIKADIAVKAQTEVAFMGVNYAVKDKVVTLTGVCPSYKSKQIVLQTVKSIHVIKGVNESIAIGPVTLTNDLPMKQSVDSVLSRYPQVWASVINGKVSLKGAATKEDLNKLLPALAMLKPAGLENAVVVPR